MATTILNLHETNGNAAEFPAQPAETVETSRTETSGSAESPEAEHPSFGFEITLAEGDVRGFTSMDEVRESILRGEIPRAARIRCLSQPTGEGKSVEDWAKGTSKLRALYAPIWSATLKGALVGLIAAGALKALDTGVTLFSINPGAGFLWLLIGASMFSPKWRFQFLAASFYFGFKAGASMTALWGAWIGVAIFAAAFGVSAGMAIGTIVGYLRSKKQELAPDAPAEGSKPLIWGLAAPLTAFITAAVLYVQVVMPAVVGMLKG